MSHHAAQAMAERVLLLWCLGDDVVEGEQWDDICALAGVDPAVFSAQVVEIRSRMTSDERATRLRELAHNRTLNALRAA